MVPHIAPIQEPRSIGLRPVPGTQEAPISRGIVTDGHKPTHCEKCGSSNVSPRYHRDLMDCIIARSRDKCSGEHLHWQCSHCGFDFTTACLPGTHFND